MKLEQDTYHRRQPVPQYPAIIRISDVRVSNRGLIMIHQLINSLLNLQMEHNFHIQLNHLEE